MRYEAILFDFDGVLVDSEPVHFGCWRDILTEFGLHLDWKTYCEYGIGAPDRALLARLCEQVDPPVALERLTAQYARKKELFRTRMLERPALTAAVLDLLAGLSQYPLGLVTTSGRDEVEPILLSGRARDYFRVVVYGGDVKRHKPSPDPYLLAMEGLGVRGGLAVEDSDSGEASARAAGLEVLRIHAQPEMPARVRDAIGSAGS